MWTRIGVKTEVEATAPPVFFKNRDEYKYSAYLAGWGSDSGEMSNPLRALVATPNRERGMGGTNRGRYSNPAMDAKLEEAMRTVDDKKREALLQEASKLVIVRLTAAAVALRAVGLGDAQGSHLRSAAPTRRPSPSSSDPPPSLDKAVTRQSEQPMPLRTSTPPVRVTYLPGNL